MYLRKESEYGVHYYSDFSEVFFGFKAVDFDSLSAQFSEFQFYRLQQIHSDKIVSISSNIQKADAHFTQNVAIAPLIQTADCCPVIVIAPKLVVSIHAGWRGVENRIVSKSLEYLKSRHFDFSEAFAFVGPHIQFDSFEVGVDVASRLICSYKVDGGESHLKIQKIHTDPKKSYINLSVIVKNQLSNFISDDKIYLETIDTVSDSRFHSFRRDKTTGRQWSFGVIKQKQD